jgi:PAS domain S-box-containing protein
MKTVFVGAGQGCQAVLELIIQHRLATLSLEILGVVDLRPDAPAMRLARDQGWATFTDLDDALALPGLELVIELTGIDSVRDEIYHRVPRHVRVMDHSLARVFWDLDEVVQHLREELEEKTRLEAEIRADRRRLQEILDSLPDAVMVVDAKERIERVNRRFEVVTGSSARDVLGQRCSEKICLKDLRERCSEPTCPRHSVITTGKPLTVIQQEGCLGWGSGGGEAYYEVTANPIRDPAGEFSVVITSREVTEQILLKRETEESARRFDQILSAVHGLITIKDLEGRYQLVNNSAAAFFGVPAERLVGRTAREALPAAVARTIEDNDRALLHDRRHVSHEEVLLLGDEERILLSERFLLNDYRGEAVGICCVCTDVTEARRLQNELVQSEKHAAVGKLAAGVAHEINNPLTGILTFTEDLLDTIPEGEAHEDLEVIMRETLRCRRIVRDLLDFSRNTKPNRRLTTLEPIIRKALDLVENQASFHDIRFDLDIGPDRREVEADPNQLQQVILNLIINARDAMDGKGRITIRADAPDGGRVVALEVGDHGCGIPEEVHARIFEPFFSTKGEQGMGLGLAVVRNIIEQHGGRIEVRSSAGEGATFRISLPMARMGAAGGDR